MGDGVSPDPSCTQVGAHSPRHCELYLYQEKKPHIPILKCGKNAPYKPQNKERRKLSLSTDCETTYCTMAVRHQFTGGTEHSGRAKPPQAEKGKGAGQQVIPTLDRRPCRECARVHVWVKAE